MAKLIPMEEAAEMLGMSADELNDLRSENGIYGYRDGSSWKFKEDEIQRVMSERSGGTESLVTENLAMEDDLGSLVDDVDMDESDAASDDLTLEPDDSGLLDSAAATDSKEPAAAAEDADDLKLSDDDDFELALNGESEEEDDFELAPMDTGAEELEDFVLEPGDDVTIDQGAGKVELEDSEELKLEESATDLAASLDDLDLGDDDVLSLDDAAVESSADTQLKSDDDFLLTPVDEAAGEESDSSSQVIALDSEEFEEASADAMLSEDATEPYVEEDASLEEIPEGAGVASSGATALAATSGAAIGQASDESYSVWNVVGLLLILLLLTPTGLMMIDLMRNMWSWSGEYALNSALMDAILGK